MPDLYGVKVRRNNTVGAVGVQNVWIMLPWPAILSKADAGNGR